jgi:Ca2+-binding RTX toxin-like protein
MPSVNQWGCHRRRLTVLALLAGFALAAPASLGAGKDRPRCGGRIATTVSAAPRIVGTRGPDAIVAGPGSDTILGMGGNDAICAGTGADRIHGGRGSDDLDGGRGEDRVLGESGNDGVGGGAGAHDQVEGGPGDDSVAGGAGDFDVLTGGPGNDGVDGGPGLHDIASYQGAGGAITVDLRRGTVIGAEGERVAAAEDVLGGSGDDMLIGTPRSVGRLDGGPGDDHLVAIGSGDAALGGPGDDACLGPLASRDSCGLTDPWDGAAVELYQSIADTSSLVIVGDTSVDVTVSRVSGGYTVESRPDSVRVHLGNRDSGACTTTSTAESVSCRGEVTSILASLGPGDDSFTVEDGVPARVSAVIDGGKGSDLAVGGRGADTIYAGDDGDPDTLQGGGGDDVLYGVNIFHPRHHSGAATMLGGAGEDLLIGGQPCDGDRFDGGPGDPDSASFARVRNSGTVVQATIGGTVLDPDLLPCEAGRIGHDVEKIEGSPGPDDLSGDGGPNTLLGRGGGDRLSGDAGDDDCVGGRGTDRARGCELTPLVP